MFDDDVGGREVEVSDVVCLEESDCIGDVRSEVNLSAQTHRQLLELYFLVVGEALDVVDEKSFLIKSPSSSIS